MKIQCFQLVAAVAIIAALTGTAEGVHLTTSPATEDNSIPIDNMMSQVESESLAEGMVESEAGAEADAELKGRGKKQRKSNWRSSGHTTM